MAIMLRKPLGGAEEPEPAARKAAKVDEATRNAVEVFMRAVRRVHPEARAVLFGSRARGTAHDESDADVAVLLRGEQGEFYRVMLVMADLAFDAMLETGVLVEALPVWEAEWENPDRYPNPSLLSNIRADGIPL